MMAVELWIDEVVKVAGNVASHKSGRKVRAYRIASKPEVPEAVSEFPSALVYPTRLISAQYSMGGPCKEIWEVKGMFYLFPDNKKTNLPDAVRYFTRIRNATLASLTLGGKVDHFVFAPEPMTLVEIEEVIDGPKRQAIEVTWEVKSDVTNEVTIGG